MNEELKKVFDEAGIALPATGMNDSPVRDCVQIVVENKARRVYFPPPMRPQKQYVNDAEELVTLSELDYSEAILAYERAKAEWRRTGGLSFVEGPREVRARFLLADGSFSDGVWTGRGWQWLAWSDDVIGHPV